MSGSVERRAEKWLLHFDILAAVGRRQQRRRLPEAGASTYSVRRAREIKRRARERRCNAVQIGWAALLWLVIVSARNTERNAMFAGRLGIVRVIPSAPYFASTAGIATCLERRLIDRAEMKWEDGGLLCDWRLRVDKTSASA